MGGRALDIWGRSLKTFINSLTNNLASISWISPSQAKDLRSQINGKIKNVANLHFAASSHWFYISQKNGGLGIAPIDHWILTKQIIMFMKNLTCTNPLVQEAVKQISTQLIFRPLPNTTELSITFPLPTHPDYEELTPLAQVPKLYNCQFRSNQDRSKIGLSFNQQPTLWCTNTPEDKENLLTALHQAVQQIELHQLYSSTKASSSPNTPPPSYSLLKPLISHPQGAPSQREYCQ